MSAPAQAVWTALGMTVVVEVCDPGALSWARQVAEDELAAADAAYSPVRDDCELARVHAACGAPTAVSPRLLEAIDVALDASRATGGLVDPGAGTRLVAARARGRAPRIRAERRPGWQLVECDRGAGTVRVARGVRIDLGATGKALIADRAARRIAQRGAGALVSVGGDLATAGPAPADGWLVRVADDHRATAGGECVRLASGALATSSITVRGEHIVDPRSRRPARGPWRTVSVAAETCVDANAASTAAIVLGAEAPAWLERAGLAALLVAHDGTRRRVAGWPEAATA
ncbi:MAG: FAD:protein FMN transferase [Solirubrobacteraceae bacterium]